MQLHFRNRSASRLWVSIMFYNPGGCGGEYGNWGTRGWWTIDPGGQAHVLNTDNRYAAYYAESADGPIWAGDIRMYVYPRAFDSCVSIGSTAARVVGCRRLDLGDSDRTFVNLT
jgi:uncharacterized membrane protein